MKINRILTKTNYFYNLVFHMLPLVVVLCYN